MSPAAAKASLALLLAAASTGLVAWPPPAHNGAAALPPPGERVFRGKPESHWRRMVMRGDLTLTGWGSTVCVVNEPPWWLRGPWWSRLLLWAFGVPTSWERVTLFPSWKAENRDFALLFQDLLQDDDPGVRQFAARVLGSYARGFPWDRAPQALQRALADADWMVRYEAARSLRRADMEWTPAVGRILRDAELRTESPDDPTHYFPTHLTDAEMEPMRRWASLRVLLAPNTAVTDAGLAHLAGLRRLAFLDLRGTRVTDAGLAHLEKATGLYRLDLDGTAVTDAGLTHLKGLERLKELNVAGTRVTEAGAADLRQALPGLKVVR
jgi:hypothetical protein